MNNCCAHCALWRSAHGQGRNVARKRCDRWVMSPKLRSVIRIRAWVVSLSLVSNLSSDKKGVGLYQRWTCGDASRGALCRRGEGAKTVVRVDESVGSFALGAYQRRSCGDARRGALRRHSCRKDTKMIRVSINATYVDCSHCDNRYGRTEPMTLWARAYHLDALRQQRVGGIVYGHHAPVFRRRANIV